MRKRSFVSFAFLFLFFIVISGAVDLQHIIVGALISLLIIWFWKDLYLRLPNMFYFKELLLFTRCILLLIGYVIKSNIEVAKILLFSKGSVTPIFLEMDMGIKTDWGRVFLATCITITPGTITIDFNPDTNMFTIYALTRESGISLYYWRLVTEIRELEKLVQRRESHVMDTDRVYDLNSISPTEGDNRSNGN